MRAMMSMRRRLPSFSRCVAAGAGAGVVAAVFDRGLSAVTHVRIPPPLPEAGSAFVAGLAAGLLFWALARISRRPSGWLWLLSLAIATAASLLIAIEPLAPPVRGLGFMSGLVAPSMQVLGLLGLVKLGTFHYPARLLGQDTVLHYLTAVTISLLVPRLARRA